MKTVVIPKGYQQVMPYLILDNASAFIDFMKDVFDAVEIMRHMRDEQVIMHAEIKLAESVIMIADSTDTYGSSPAGMFVYVPDADATYNKAIATGATSIAAPSDQSYGRSAGVKDAYGNTWWITTNK
ncbi:MAG: VOC family protein [Flavipsychrobacter sp.]|nr:VOC family protein [Flavipsychrobacter sp.]